MTDLLEQAFAEASKLSPSEQEAFAVWMLAELAGERDWQRALTESPEALAKLADEALAEYHGQRTRPLDPDRL